MLWDAGQRRIAREQRERLAELFTASRDAALDVLVSTGQAKAKGAWRRPHYLTSDAQPSRSPETRDRALASLALMFPGVVRRGDS